MSCGETELHKIKPSLLSRQTCITSLSTCLLDTVCIITFIPCSFTEHLVVMRLVSHSLQTIILDGSLRSMSVRQPGSNQPERTMSPLCSGSMYRDNDKQQEDDFKPYVNRGQAKPLRPRHDNQEPRHKKIGVLLTPHVHSVQNSTCFGLNQLLCA